MHVAFGLASCFLPELHWIPHYILLGLALVSTIIDMTWCMFPCVISCHSWLLRYKLVQNQLGTSAYLRSNVWIVHSVCCEWAVYQKSHLITTRLLWIVSYLITSFVLPLVLSSTDKTISEIAVFACIHTISTNRFLLSDLIWIITSIGEYLYFIEVFVRVVHWGLPSIIWKYLIEYLIDLSLGLSSVGTYMWQLWLLSFNKFVWVSDRIILYYISVLNMWTEISVWSFAWLPWTSLSCRAIELPIGLFSM